MKQKDKELLLRDLCGRLPYWLKCEINGKVEILDSICDDDGYYFNFIGEDKEGYTLDEVKPYLFPMSSMTKEQREEWYSLMARDTFGILYHTTESLDYLYKNHIDIRGLIPRGLAIDATGLNVY